jgi:cyclic pyranopterin phosphate synthase
LQVNHSSNQAIDGIRISITERCNLKCIYCHKEGICSDKVTPEMSPEEISKIVEVSCLFNISKVKLTGGEPLLRKDLPLILKKIRAINSIKEISMTTNGVYLEEQAKIIKKSGLQRVNISLDTLDKKLFRKITGSYCLKQVIQGIHAAKEAGLSPIKLNIVITKYNIREIGSLINFARKQNIDIQFIELLPIFSHLTNYFISLEYLEAHLKKKAKFVKKRDLHGRCTYFFGKLKIEVIRGYRNPVFCLNCKRIRVTSTGKLKPCLLRNDNLVDIISLIRMNAPINTLKAAFLRALNLKEPFFKTKNGKIKF